MNTFSIQPGPVEALGLLGHEQGAGGDDEHVVVELVPVGEVHRVGLEVDVVDPVLHERDAVVELAARGRTMSSGCVRPKGTNSRPGW